MHVEIDRVVAVGEATGDRARPVEPVVLDEHVARDRIAVIGNEHVHDRAVSEAAAADGQLVRGVDLETFVVRFGISARVIVKRDLVEENVRGGRCSQYMLSPEKGSSRSRGAAENRDVVRRRDEQQAGPHLPHHDIGSAWLHVPDIRLHPAKLDVGCIDIQLAFDHDLRALDGREDHSATGDLRRVHLDALRGIRAAADLDEIPGRSSPGRCGPTSRTVRLSCTDSSRTLVGATYTEAVPLPAVCGVGELSAIPTATTAAVAIAPTTATRRRTKRLVWLREPLIGRP